MANKAFALGMVVADRWDLTHKALQSLYHTDQLNNTYDLFLIENGCNAETSAKLTEWVEGGLVPVKNLVRTKRLSMGPAWNLFLELSKDYLYRTKLDNDMIFANTPIVSKPLDEACRKQQRLIQNAPSPGDFGTNPGSIPNASIQMGAGKKIRPHTKVRHTRFLDAMQSSMEDLGVGLISLVPVPMGRTMDDVMSEIANRHWRNEPYLIGSCMMIPKECFDKIGYFEDRLPRFIDREYSQRAMAVGINIGYVQDYCVIDMGVSNHTLSAEEMQQYEWKANDVVAKLGFNAEFCHSKWETVSKKIKKATLNNQIVTLKLN